MFFQTNKIFFQEQKIFFQGTTFVQFFMFCKAMYWFLKIYFIKNVWKVGFQLMLILGLPGMYFDAVVVFVTSQTLLLRLAFAILCLARGRIFTDFLICERQQFLCLPHYLISFLIWIQTWWCNLTRGLASWI